MLLPWLELARISNLPTVWTNVAAGWLLAGGGWAWGDGRLAWLLLAGSLLYTGGMILNDAADVKFDREHRKERPIPSGRVTAGVAWGVGLAMMGMGAAAAVVALANLWVLGALVAAILFYDLYHKPWAGAVWVMGSCRVLLVWLAGSAAFPGRSLATTGSEAFVSGDDAYAVLEQGVGLGWGGLGDLPNEVVMAGLVLGCYIVGLTMIARLEGRGGAGSALAAYFPKALLYAPGIVAVALLINSGALRPVMILGDLRPLAPLVLVFGFAGMVAFAAHLMRRGGPAIGQAVGILLAGIPIVDALAISQISLSIALGFAALAPLLRLWQRWVAAT